MKKICALFLALSLLIALAAPVYAEKTISGAYVYEEGGMPKYWLDFTGSVADNVVLHCFFQTDSWYETYYVLDFKASVPESHQDTYRIETVWDAKGNDVSNWFKTVSLTIQEDCVRLYIERDDKTLAGGPSSTILTGLYEMTPAKAGVVYEAYSDNKLQTWVLLNKDYAELHFADGTEWHLQAESIDDAIHAGLMQKSMEYILGSSGSWVAEAESSPDFDSGKFADQWSDVIYERDEYETTDGSRIKVSPQYDPVYQDGDRLYMGPDAYAPDGWTRLEKTY